MCYKDFLLTITSIQHYTFHFMILSLHRIKENKMFLCPTVIHTTDTQLSLKYNDCPDLKHGLVVNVIWRNDDVSSWISSHINLN